jgi:hypothetical protein
MEVQTFHPPRLTAEEEAAVLARDLIDWMDRMGCEHVELIPRLREACSSNERAQAFIAALWAATGDWVSNAEWGDDYPDEHSYGDDARDF